MQDTSTGSANGGLIRIGGLAVVLALSIHLFVNGVLKEFPPEDLSLLELQAYLAAEEGTWAIVHGLKYLALVGLVLFSAGVHARTCRMRGGLGAGWGVVGLLGTAIHVTNAMIANGIEILAFYDFSRLSEEPSLFWLVFYMVRVLFTAEIVAWGIVILGFSMAGFRSKTLPWWITSLGFVGSGACFVSGVFVVSVLTEGWASMLIDVANLTGLTWFASVGVFMMMRGDS
jgi:hypothetical protein